MAACRWPNGFVCPRCGKGRAYELVKLRRWECSGCRHQVSLTAGTILHNTKTPLTVWFWAAYLMTTDKRGVSALLLQRQLALRRYETAWMLLHKFHRAMVNLANSFFATIGGGCPWLPSKPCLASEPRANLRIISRYGAQRIFLRRTTSYWGFLKQPDKQKLPR